jgi:hypothetical protein
MMRTLSGSLALLSILLMGDQAQAQNAYLTNGFMPRFCQASTNYPIVVRVRNSAAQPLITFKVDWRWNNGPVQEGNWQSTTGITGNQYWEYTHPTPFNQPASSEGVLKVWVQGIGDTDPSNDTLTFRTTPLGNWTEKTQLLEMWTATWCQFCPPANSVGNTQNGLEDVVVLKHHADDEFSDPTSTTYFEQYNVTFTPGGVIEQGEYGSYQPNGNHGFWPAELAQRSIGVSPVQLALTTDYNSLSRNLTANLSATFTATLGGAFTVNLFIVEDHVPGPQNNAPAGYLHQQVVRRVMSGVEGLSGPIPSPPVAGNAYTHGWVHTLPESWVAENIRVVAVVTHRVNGQAYTLNTISSGPLVVGVDEHDAFAAGLQVHPNPGSRELWVDLTADPAPVVLQLFAADGRAVLEQRSVLAGEAIRVDGYQGLPAGTYLLRVERNGMVATRRVVKLDR